MMFILSSPVYAVISNPGAFLIEQPDGTTFAATMHGDEYRNWVTTPTGHTVVRNRRDNHWEYAEMGIDGKLKSSGIRVKGDMDAPLYLGKAVRPIRDENAFRLRGEAFRKKLEKRRKKPESVDSLSTGVYRAPAVGTTSSVNGLSSIYYSPSLPSNWPAQPISGSSRLLLIRVSFSDRTIISSVSDTNKSVFDTSLGALSVVNYYKDNSFGSFNILPAVHTQTGSPAGILQIYTFYDHPYNSGNYSWVADVLQSASQYISFSDFDADHDGVISSDELAVHFILAGYEEATGTTKYPSVWAHYDPSTVEFSGIKIDGYSVSGELNGSSKPMPIGVIVHELAHNILGLPDLYDTSGMIDNYGIFSLMSSGSWGSTSYVSANLGNVPVALDAWSRQYLGWGVPRQPESGTTVSFMPALSAVDSPVKMIDSSVSSSEYFLVENRYPVGWDKGMYAWLGTNWKGGLLITHVDESVGTPGNNDINDYEHSPGHVGVMVEEADTSYCSMFSEYGSCPGDLKKLFYKGNNVAFGINTVPDSGYTDFTPSNLGLYMISSPDRLMTAYYHKGGFEAPAAVVTGTPPSPIKAGTYLLTVGGEDLAAYRWRLLKEGSTPGKWSVETVANKQISVSTTTAGTYRVEVVGKDVAGNWQGTAFATSVTWTVDTTAPITNITAKPALRSKITTPEFSFSSEEGATFECKVDSGVYSACTTPYTVPVTLKDGTHTFYVRAKDVAGNYDATPENYSWTVDTLPPTLTVTQPLPTNLSSVRITGTKELGSTLSATLPDGVTCDISKVAASATSWSCSAKGYAENSQTTLSFTATDVAMNSRGVTATIVNDSMAPTGTVLIKGTENSDTWTNKTGVTLNLTCDGTGSDCSQVCLSNTPTCSTWTKYADTKSWTLTRGNGTKTVFATFRDKAGNSSTQNSDTILLDATPPTGKVTINNGSVRTNNRVVSLDFSATDNLGGSGVAEMRYAMQSTFAGVDWQPYAAAGEIALAGADGIKTVYAQFRDIAGNLSSVLKDIITLDTTPPTLTINTITPTSTTTKIISGTKMLGSTITTITVPDGVTYVLDSSATSITTTKWSCTLDNLATGTNRISVTAADLAGNTTYKTASVICLANVPSGWTSNGLSGQYISALAMSPADPDTLYAGNFDGIIYKTIDGGSNWEQIFLEAVNVYAISVNPRNPDMIYAATGHAGAPEEYPSVGGIYKTIDGGATWSQVLPAVYAYSMQLDPLNPDKILVGSAGNGIYRSTDAGTTWTNYKTGLPLSQSATPDDVYDIKFDKSNPLVVYIAANNGGIYKTITGGTTWAATGLKHGPQLRLAIDPSNKAIIYAGGDGPGSIYNATDRIRLHKSIDAGLTWKDLFIPVNGSYGSPYIYGITVNPYNTLEAYVAASGWGVFKTSNGGTSWKEVNSGLSTYVVGDGGLVMHPAAPQILYLATDSGVFKTMNGGE